MSVRDQDRHRGDPPFSVKIGVTYAMMVGDRNQGVLFPRADPSLQEAERAAAEGALLKAREIEIGLYRPATSDEVSRDISPKLLERYIMDDELPRIRAERRLAWWKRNGKAVWFAVGIGVMVIALMI